MQANNLTICVPKSKDSLLCDKNCPYCVSKMTGQVEHDYDLMVRNFPKVKRTATNSQVSTVMITGKGEPLLNFGGVAQICQAFKEYPLEIQTNGIWLKDNIDAIKMLKRFGIDTIAFSIDVIEFLDELSHVFYKILKENLTTRISINITNKIPDYFSFEKIFEVVKRYKVHQLLFRNINIPKKTIDNIQSRSTQDWIKRNVPPDRYGILLAQMQNHPDYKKEKIRRLPHGADVYDIDGISVSFSDYCIQETNNTFDIRSLIMLEDGHLYTSWDKLSSRLF